FSADLTTIMNRMVGSPVRMGVMKNRASGLLPPGHLCTQALLSSPEFARRVARCALSRFEYLADLHLGAVVARSALEPLDRLLFRFGLPDPEAGDQLLRLGEWAVGHGSLVSVEFDPRSFGTGLQSLPSEHHARLHELFVEPDHLLDELLARKNAG